MNKPAFILHNHKEQDTFNYGSPGYAAPEQYKGKGRSTPQTDVFALGVILFQMLTGYDPSLKPLTFPSMKSINPAIPEKLELIVKRAIELDPLKRYISVQEFKETLAKYANMSIEDEKPQKNPNKLAAISKKLTYITLAIPFIIPFIIIIVGFIAGMAEAGNNETIGNIIYILIELLVTAMFLCPVAGLITGIIASWKAAKDITCEPAGEAIGCNALLMSGLILFAFILFPNFMKARVTGQLSGCESNIKNIATALEMYGKDNNNTYPDDLTDLTDSIEGRGYMKTIPVCPSSPRGISASIHGKNSFTYKYKVSSNFNNFTIWCTIGHPGCGMEPGYPQYSPGQGLIIR